MFVCSWCFFLRSFSTLGLSFQNMLEALLISYLYKYIRRGCFCLLVSMCVICEGFLVTKCVKRPLERTLHSNWNPLESFRWNACLLIRFTVIYYIVQYTCSSEAHCTLFSLTPFTHSFSHRLHPSCNFASLDKMHWKERRQNRKITEIIRFNYIYIHFCLSWINSSIWDFALQNSINANNVKHIYLTAVAFYYKHRLIAPIYSIETVLVC